MAKKLEAEYGAIRAGSVNLGDPSRVYVRKAQYHWRWDWGPEFITCGPWKPVVLKLYGSRIVQLQSSAIVDVESRETSLTLVTQVESVTPRDVEVEMTLRDSKGSLVWREQAALDGKRSELVAQVKFAPGSIQLWWPVGYGEATLYELGVRLLGKKHQVLDQTTRKIGFRDVQLCQLPLAGSPGTSFYFRVNGLKVFMGGSNWIPADSFLTRMNKEKYLSWLQLLKRGNQNMIRVWGGGVYEDDAFYDICDELGILVWQDFGFACGIYPAHTSFVNSVKQEAECNIRRLRHHPSLAILCGNNEDYQQILQWNVEGGLPAAVIYEKVLPKLVRQMIQPPLPYVYGSPYGGEGWDTSDATIGDVHQWNVWAGSGEPYQDFDILGGRFISEFGVPSYPCLSTMEAFFSDNSVVQWYPESKAIQQHTKAGSYVRRFAILMNENFRMTGDLESYTYLTQLMQAEAIGSAYRVWRRKWAGDGHEETGGVLVWQLNDCWPCVSWSLVDYYLRPKPAFYTVARELRPITVGVQRTVQKNRPTDRPRAFYEFGAFQSVGAILDVWATNSTLSPVTLSLDLVSLNLEFDSDWTETQSRMITLKPNSSTSIFDKITCPHPYEQEPPRIPHPSCNVVYAAILKDPETGEVLAQSVDWPQPLKFLEPRDPNLQLGLKGEMLTVKVDDPVKGLVFSVPGGEDDIVWGDNCIDVMPGLSYTLRVSGLDGRKMHVQYLGCEKARPIEIVVDNS